MLGHAKGSIYIDRMLKSKCFMHYVIHIITLSHLFCLFWLPCRPFLMAHSDINFFNPVMEALISCIRSTIFSYTLDICIYMECHKQLHQTLSSLHFVETTIPSQIWKLCCMLSFFICSMLWRSRGHIHVVLQE